MQQTIAFLFTAALVCGAVQGQTQTKPSITPAPEPATSRAPSGRIVNGDPAFIENYPFIVGMFVNWYHTCGASVITAKHAVSAAHCLSNPNFLNSFVRSQVHLLGGSTNKYIGGWKFPVANYSIHPNYNAGTFDFDAAVLTIVHSFTGYINIATISLQNTEVTPFTLCYAIGWGATNGTTQITPQNLQFTFMQSISNSFCQNYISLTISEQMTCAVNVDRYGSTCQGDSGGPLVCNGKLTGITSFGRRGCPSQVPSVFAKVMSPSIRSFIRQVAGI